MYKVFIDNLRLLRTAVRVKDPIMNYDKLKTPYKVYTTEFDRVVDASTLIAEYVEPTDEVKAETKRSMYCEPYNYDIQRRLSDFYMNGGAKAEADLYATFLNKSAHDAMRDTAVQILVDVSGSMRGRPITSVIPGLHRTMQTLDAIGVPYEVLGFTSTEFKGGQAYKKWVEAGRPKAPGRLNDLLHIVFKSFDGDTDLNALSIMGSKTIMKENIDGEAIDWARSRLTLRPESRKIFMMISDVAPVDDATQSANMSTEQSGCLERDVVNASIRMSIDKSIDMVHVISGGYDARWYNEWYDVCYGYYSSERSCQNGVTIASKISEMLNVPRDIYLELKRKEWVNSKFTKSHRMIERSRPKSSSLFRYNRSQYDLIGLKGYDAVSARIKACMEFGDDHDGLRKHIMTHCMDCPF